jgi:hypothetical protein
VCAQCGIVGVGFGKQEIGEDKTVAALPEGNRELSAEAPVWGDDCII